MQSEVTRIVSGGVDLAVYDEGEGTPILLIHGFASSAKANWYEPGWVKFLREAGYRVISFDNRGHGKSAKLYAPELYTAPAMAWDAAAIIEQLGIGPVHVMGYSMGARITAFLTMQTPKLVKTAVLAGLAENMIKGVPGSETVAQGLEASSLDDVSDPQARAFRIFADRTGSDRDALAACMRAARQKIPEAELSVIVCPVLVAAGTEDDIAGEIAPLQEAITGAEALPIPRRDHMRAVGDKVYMDGVLRFLQRHG